MEPSSYMNTIIKRQELMLYIEGFTTRMSHLADLAESTKNKKDLFTLASQAKMERDNAMIEIKNYFRYEKENNLPADISLRYLYKEFQKTML